jgi:hypothetical protein
MESYCRKLVAFDNGGACEDGEKISRETVAFVLDEAKQRMSASSASMSSGSLAEVKALISLLNVI